MSLHVKGVDDLNRIAAALKESADRDLQKAVSKAMRDVAKPVGLRVLREGASGLPHRGGLASRVASTGRAGLSASLRGKSASVTVILRNKGANLPAIDAGVLRHPVFGGRTWVRQSVRPNLFTDAFQREADVVRREVLESAENVLQAIARKD